MAKKESNKAEKNEADPIEYGAETPQEKDVAQAQAQNQAQPSLAVLTQYVKDFSFENPNAPLSILAPKAPKVSINVSVNARRLDGRDHEISLRLTGESVSEEQKNFVFELDYCGVFRLNNFPDEHLPAVIMVECPRLLFPFARQVLADSTRNGGFPPLMMDPIDFTALYRANLKKHAENQKNEENEENAANKKSEKSKKSKDS